MNDTEISPTPSANVGGAWRPISEADKGIDQIITAGDMRIGNSLPIWARDSDGRVFECLWADDGKRAYWWDFEAESPVNPVEFMPHPLDPRFAKDSPVSNVGGSSEPKQWTVTDKSWMPVHRDTLEQLGNVSAIRSGLGRLSPAKCEELGMSEEESKAVEALWSLTESQDFYIKTGCVPEDVFALSDCGNHITLHFSEIKSAREFRGRFPVSIVSEPQEYSVPAGIKPLAWKLNSETQSIAEVFFGRYYVERNPSDRCCWGLQMPGEKGIGLYPTENFEAAKAAAQADYESRKDSPSSRLSGDLEAQVAFTLSDASRLLRKQDVEGACPHPNDCFYEGDRVRCGPCAVKASAAKGVKIDDIHSHLPEVCRLRREVKAASARISEMEPAIRKAGQVAIDHLIDTGMTFEASGDDLADYLTRIVDACVRAALSSTATEGG